MGLVGNIKTECIYCNYNQLVTESKMLHLFCELILTFSIPQTPSWKTKYLYSTSRHFYPSPFFFNFLGKEALAFFSTLFLFFYYISSWILFVDSILLHASFVLSTVFPLRVILGPTLQRALAVQLWVLAHGRNEVVLASKPLSWKRDSAWKQRRKNSL